jgi:hypothetical protein
MHGQTNIKQTSDFVHLYFILIKSAALVWIEMSNLLYVSNYPTRIAPCESHSVCMYACVTLLDVVCLSTLFWMHMTCSAAPNCSCWDFCIEMSQFGTDAPNIFLNWWYTSSPIFHQLLSTATFRFMVSGVLNFVINFNKCLFYVIKQTQYIQWGFAP